MKHSLFAMALVSLASPASAGGINFEVTKLAPKVFAEGTMGVDACYVTGTITNTTDQEISIDVILTARLKEDTMSNMTYSAALNGGLTTSIYDFELAAGGSKTDTSSLIGVDCADVTGLTITPKCTYKGDGSSCVGDIDRAPASIIALYTEGDDTPVGQMAAPTPKGGMHGEWNITGAGGATLFTLNITQELDQSAKGSFTSHPALCAVLKQDDSCAQGAVSDKELRYISFNDDRVVVTALVGDDDDSKMNLIWAFKAGTGKLGNINSANIASFSASK